MDQRPDAAPGLPDEVFPRFAFEGAPVGLACLSGPDRRILAANPALAALLGTDPATLRGRSLADLDHPQGSGTSPDLAGEAWLRRADGSPIRVRLRAGPERDGCRIVAVEAVADAAAEARQTHSEQTHLALASAGLGEWSWSPADGRVVLSDRAAAILGYPAGATPPWAGLQEMVSRDDLDRLRATVQDAVAKAIPYAVEMRVRRANDGQEAWTPLAARRPSRPTGRSPA